MSSLGQLPQDSAIDSVKPSPSLEEIQEQLRDLLLTEEEEARLCVEDPPEALRYKTKAEELERLLDLEGIARGLTADLPTFMRQAWNIVEPETPLQWSWHYDYLAEWLTLISSGEFKERFPEKLGLIINVPPRSGKSTFASVLWPIWTWLKYPGRRFLFASHNGDLAQGHNNKRAFLIQSQFFQERFGQLSTWPRFKLIARAADMLRNDHLGQFHVTSIGSGSTGFGGMILVGDDLLDREKAFSALAKTKANHWIDSSFSKMLDDQVRGVFVHISQRLAVADPTGHILGEDGSPGKPNQWIHIKIPREATEQQEYVFPISKEEGAPKVHVRLKGDILQADRNPPSVVVRLKAVSRTWANQEQQEPTPETGALLNPNWLKWFKGSTPMPAFFQVIVSVDCNFKAAAENSDVAIQKWALVYRHRYLLDRRTESIGYIATKQAIKEMARGGHTVPWLSVPMPPATQCLIENKANGPAVCEELRADPEFHLSVIDYNPMGSKTQRFIAATGDAEAGLILMPEDAPWIGTLRKTLCDYAGEGSVAKDDDCDAFSQLINWSRQSQYGLLGYLDKQAAEAAGKVEPIRCLVKDENDRDLILEWDQAKGDWFDPKNPERRFAAGPDSANTAEAGTAGDPAGDGASSSAG